MADRKHADVIRAWLDGAHVQLRRPDYGSWRDTPTPNFHTRFEYRVKPTVVRSRRCLVLNTHLQHYVLTVTEHKVPSPAVVQADVGFQRWIDTEWQEHEV